jgi:uncharacterized protein (TIGR03085 family)
VPNPAESLSQSERAALADLLEELGPDQPTCCEGWRTRDLAAHLVVRDRRPDSMPGLVLGGPFAAWTERVRSRAGRTRMWAQLLHEVRSGPAGWLPGAWPAVDRALNGTEMLIHHEDVRRAQPDWAPRELPAEVQDRMWRAVPLMARGGALRRTAGGLVVRRTDRPAGEASEQRLREGSPTTTVAGEPLEVLLWVSGREDVARVEVTTG